MRKTEIFPIKPYLHDRALSFIALYLSANDHPDPIQQPSVFYQQGGSDTVAVSNSQTHIIILGAGKGGTALLETFLNLPRIRVLGIADKDHDAQGLKLAQLHRIPTSQNPLDPLKKKRHPPHCGCDGRSLPPRTPETTCESRHRNIRWFRF